MRKNLRVIVNIGLPGSGKSTWTRNFLAKNTDFVCVNRDAFRFMLRNEGWTEPKIEALITEAQTDMITKALSKKLNVIVDATHLKQSYINQLWETVKYKADMEFMVFDVPIETCIQRDIDRGKAGGNCVGEAVIRKLNKDWVNLKDCFDFQNRSKRPAHEDRFVPVKYDNTLQDAVVFDIDGTLALMGRRGEFDWHKVDVDDENHVVIEQITFHKNLGRKIILVSGRDESAREKTMYWLEFYGIHYDTLFMRPKDNYQKDTVIKKDIYNNELKGKYNVICVYDDRLQVVQMWYELGIFCYNVNQGLKYF